LPDFNVYRVGDLDACVLDNYFSSEGIKPAKTATRGQGDLAICRLHHLCQMPDLVQEFRAQYALGDPLSSLFANPNLFVNEGLVSNAVV
jgi:hypothetical protein